MTTKHLQESAGRAMRDRLLVGRSVVAATLFALAQSCSGRPAPGGTTGAARVTASALMSAGVVAVELHIAGAGIPSPIVVALAHQQVGWGALVGAIPAGPGRTFSVSGRDVAGVETYRGRVDGVTITPGETVTVVIIVQPLSAPPRFGDAAPVIDGLFLSSSSVAPGQVVQLRVAAHDPGAGDVLTYAWSATGGAFGAATSASTTWAAPQGEGTFHLTVRVTDSKGTAATISVDVDVAVALSNGTALVEVTFNDWPSVNSVQADPAHITVSATTLVSVDASDPDGDALSYGWSSDCVGTFGSANSAKSSFVLAMTPASATCTMTVTVDDRHGGSNVGTLVLPVGDPTIARAPVLTSTQQSLTFAAPDDTVSFKASAVDPNGGPVTFSWSTNGGALGVPTTIGGSTSVTWTASAVPGPLVLVRLIVTNGAKMTTVQDFQVRLGLSWCAPFSSACTNVDEVCFSVALDNLTGACLPHGGAGDGEPCAPSLGSTGCRAGFACVTQAGTDVCLQECNLFDERVTCPAGQLCSVDGVCSSIVGDGAALATACAPGTDEGTSCGSDTNRWRGVCTGTGPVLNCSEVCRLGTGGCGSPSQQCVEVFDDGLDVGVCVEKGACGDGGSEYASCDQCLVTEADACCAAESAACVSGTACHVLTDCVRACGEFDGACRDRCMEASPNGVAPLSALTTCLQGSTAQGFVGACGAICR